MQSARDIYQYNLDHVSRALKAYDLGLMLENLALPHWLINDEAEFVVTSTEDLVIQMTDYGERLREMGVTDFIRVCTEAGFVPGRWDMIVGEHVTHFGRAGAQVVDHCLNRLTLMKIGKRWKAVKLESLTSNRRNPIISNDMAMAQSRERQRTRPVP